jgi:cyclic pyranopterin phosphate synthase
MAERFTHYDEQGRSRMVDVTGKPATERMARAGAFLRMGPATVAAFRGRDLPKGDPFEAARLAGILAAKKTAELIPLCHPLPLTHVEVRLELGDDGVAIEAEARCTGPTGVEMEALTAAAVAGLTLYDMAKAVDKGMVLEAVRLLEKRGGKSGDWKAE